MLQMPWLALSLALVWTTVTMFYGVPRKKNLDKLQRVQIRAARIVSGVDRRQQSALHLSHKSKNRLQVGRMTGQPDYLAAEFRCYQLQLCLRSSSQELLPVPLCKTTLGRRGFSVAVPRVWNS